MEDEWGLHSQSSYGMNGAFNGSPIVFENGGDIPNGCHYWDICP